MLYLKLLPELACDALLAIIVTACFCRYQTKHSQSVAFGTVLLGTLSTAVLFVMADAVFEEGWQIFLPRYWADQKGGFFALFFGLWLCAAWSVLPAAGTVISYRRRLRKAASPGSPNNALQRTEAGDGSSSDLHA